MALDIVDCLKASHLKFYAYGSRFNSLGQEKADSDWDFAVECSNADWEGLKLAVGKLGFYLFQWIFLRHEDQPVFSNYPDPCYGLGDAKSKNEVDVRKIPSEDALGAHRNEGWKQIS